MEVSGQDILTRDKVSLRVNLTALWQVADVVQARAALQNFMEFVYKELQFALREAIGFFADHVLATDIRPPFAALGLVQHL